MVSDMCHLGGLCGMPQRHTRTWAAVMLPPLTSQHCTESKMPSLLCKTDSLSVLIFKLYKYLNIYLLLYHPQITLLWGVVIKPLMQYSSSLTACVDSLKEGGQNPIFKCMMSAPEEKCNNQKISALRNSLFVNKSHADGTNKT